MKFLIVNEGSRGEVDSYVGNLTNIDELVDSYITDREQLLSKEDGNEDYVNEFMEMEFGGISTNCFVEISFGEEDSYQSGTYSPIFPIGIDKNDDPREMLMARPWFEREMLKLSTKAIVYEDLGKDQDPDVLFIGFSAMDWMIHDYGPFSQEIMDACLKLDIYLGDFIDYVDREVGLENVMFVLTADHGGLPIPEYLINQGEKAGRIKKNILGEALKWIDEEIVEKYGKNLYYLRLSSIASSSLYHCSPNFLISASFTNLYIGNSNALPRLHAVSHISHL